jgi:hypothetical protein
MNEALKNLIIANGLEAAADARQFQAGDDALSDRTIERINSDPQGKAELIAATSGSEANVVLRSVWRAGNGQVAAVSTLAQLFLSDWHAISGRGVDMSRKGLRDALRLLATAELWPAGLLDRVLAMGRWWVSPKEDAGLQAVTVDDIEATWTAYRAAATETKNEVLLSANQSTDGQLKISCRVTPVECDSEGKPLRRGTPQNLQSDELTAAVAQLLEGVTNG